MSDKFIVYFYKIKGNETDFNVKQEFMINVFAFAQFSICMCFFYRTEKYTLHVEN